MADQGETCGTHGSFHTSHYLPLYTAAQMRRTDSAAIKGMGIPGVVLMERAGMAVAEHLLESYCDDHCFVVLAGKGNNGGDGFVAARHLLEAGSEVRVFAAGRAAEYKGDALVNLKILGKLGLKVEHMPSKAVLGRALAIDCVIVDAVFGTGFAGEPRGKAGEFISAAAAAAERYGIPVVAVDIASGIDASTGEVARNTLPADTTVTFHTPKLGHFMEPGSYFTGDVVLADIGIPAEASAPADHFLIDPDIVAALIPAKMEFDHKFSTGRVLVAGGSTGLTGAACMAAESALRSGAGVVTAAVPSSLNPIFEQKLLEVMTAPLEDGGVGFLTEAALRPLLEKSGSFDCVAFGPGLGKSAGSAALTARFLAACEAPVVLDADGLNAMAGKLNRLKKRSAPTILTPHPGELGRLLGIPAADVATRRLTHAKAAARKSGAVVVLKGAATIVTDGDITLVNTSGNPGLATAGSGDVLTGLIAALVSKGLDPLQAAAAGVFLHGAAADLAAEDVSRDNLIASDLIDYLPLAFAGLQDEEDEHER
jgi:NAD(P)H-hydrate epimerase